MNKLLFKRLTSLMTAFTVASGINYTVFGQNTNDNSYASREYVVSEFVKSIGRNNLSDNENILNSYTDSSQIDNQYVQDFQKAVASGLISGYTDKTLKPKENVKRIEALSVLARCIPENIESTESSIEFSDVPNWAKNDIKRLSELGIVKGYGNGRLGADDNITISQVKMFTDRSDELINKDKPQENFYNYINNKSFRNANLVSLNKIDAKQSAVISASNAWSEWGEVSKAVSDAEDELLDKLLNDKLEYNDGSAAQRIHDMYLCMNQSTDLTEDDMSLYNDLKQRIIEAKDINELIEISSGICRETGVNPLFDISASLDAETNEPYPSIALYCGEEASLIAFNSSTQEKLLDTYKNLLKEYMDICNFEVSEDDIDKAVYIQETAGKEENHIFEFYKGLTAKLENNPNYTEDDFEQDLNKILKEHPEIDPDNLMLKNDTGKTYDVEEADNIMSVANPSHILERVGFDPSDKIIFPYADTAQITDSILTEDNLHSLKINALVSLCTQLGAYANDDEKQMLKKFGVFHTKIISDSEWDGESLDFVSNDNQSIDKNSVLKDITISQIKNSLPYDIGILYCDYYYDDNTTQYIKDMVEKIKSAYKKRIENSSWLSEETKANAAKKIDKINAVAGYQDNFEFARILPPSKGGTYFNNRVRICRSDLNMDIKIARDKELLQELMLGSADTRNVDYDFILNNITIYSGILNKPFFDKDASYASNLGAIGSLIGHEMSHAFDSEGSKYDAYGRLTDWWSDSDEEHFKERCKDFVEYCEYFESTYGENGDELEIGENMADFAAMQCVMDILGDDNNAKKEALESYAKIWANLGQAKYLTNNSDIDNPHSADNARVNAVISSLDCFYELYNVKEGDLMYTPPEKRLKLWE